MGLIGTPGRIGNLQLSGRCVFPAMLMNFATDRGEVTDRLIHFYRRLARGGFAMIVTECVFPQFKGGIATRGLALYDDRFIPGFMRLASAVKAEGSRLCVQLFFDGAGRTFASEETVSIGPSDLTPYNGPFMRPMTEAEMEQMIADFAAAARRAQAAGADAIELHMGHGHLLGRFLSPHFNRRQDAYGGSIENRMRFPLQVLDRVRDAVGQDMPITARLCMTERIDGGIDLREAIAIGQRLRAAGLDAVHTSAGTGTTPLGLASIFPTSFAPETPFAEMAAQFKREAEITTIFAGKVSQPETAARLLDSGAVDFVSVGRAALADPDWPRRAAEKRAVVPCIACNQGCADQLIARKEITCLVNPTVGFENDFAQAEPLKKSDRFVVIGAGVGGLVCALSLAERGAQVVLYETSDQIGGLYRYASRAPGKQQYDLYLAYLRDRLSRSSIDVRLSSAPDAAAHETDAAGMFWAAGSVPRPWSKGRFEAPIVSGWECFDHAFGRAKQRLIVVGAGQVGCDAALWLAELGHSVTLVDQAQDPLAFSGTRRHDYHTALRSRNVECVWGTRAEGGEGQRVRFVAAQAGDETLRDCDAVIAAIGKEPRARPAFAANAFSIGDAARPGTALDAVRQAAFHAAFAAARTRRQS